MSRIALFSAVFMLAGWSAGAAELRLRGEATVASGMVRLADLADIAEADPEDVAALQRVLLFPAPGVGKERIVRRGEIVELLTLAEVDVKRYAFSGAEQVVIRRGAGVPPARTARGGQAAPSTVEQSVEHALVSYLEQHQPSNVAWNVAPAIPSRFLSPLKHAERITVAGGQAPFTGRQSFELIARVQGHERRFPIEADIAALPRAVVAVRPVGRGEVIRPDDVETKAIAASAAADERLLAREEVIGREATKGLTPGQPITAGQVQLQRLVHRGDKVMVHSVADGVSITTSGKATQDGALDEQVAVELEDPKRQIVARVAGPLRVEIGAAAAVPPPAAVPSPPATSIEPPGNKP